MTSYEQRRQAQIEENIRIGNDVTVPLMPTIMGLDEMTERLIYVGEQGLVADSKTGRVRKKHVAVDEYAASLHSFSDDKGKTITVPALKLWIKSTDRKGADVLAWVPGEGMFCSPPEPKQANEIAFNTWRGLQSLGPPPNDWLRRVRPFLKHVRYLVPIRGERHRFVRWLGHLVQKPEVLPHTYYLFITETTGIGRNLLASMLVRAFRGHVAAGVDLPELLDGGGYTGRLSQKLLAIVDEAHEGGGPQRYKRAQRLKSIITEEHRNINHKYGYQIVEKNCLRWLTFSNHWDAVPLDEADRRCITIQNPKVRKPAQYYEQLYALLDDPLFICSVRHFLEALDLSKFKPGEHAPLNAAKRQMLDRSKSELDHTIENFRADCPAELTTLRCIRDHIDWSGVGGYSDRDLKYALERAGLVSTGRRLIIDGQKHAVVIVKGEWTPEAVKNCSAQKLEEILAPQVRKHSHAS